MFRQSIDEGILNVYRAIHRASGHYHRYEIFPILLTAPHDFQQRIPVFNVLPTLQNTGYYPLPPPGTPECRIHEDTSVTPGRRKPAHSPEHSSYAIVDCFRAGASVQSSVYSLFPTLGYASIGCKPACFAYLARPDVLQGYPRPKGDAAGRPRRRGAPNFVHFAFLVLRRFLERRFSQCSVEQGQCRSVKDCGFRLHESQKVVVVLQCFEKLALSITPFFREQGRLQPKIILLIQFSPLITGHFSFHLATCARTIL